MKDSQFYQFEVDSSLKKTVSVEVKTREDTMSIAKEQKFLITVDIEETCALRNFNEKVHLHPERKYEWIKEAKGKILQGTADGGKSAHCRTTSSTVSLPGKNERTRPNVAE